MRRCTQNREQRYHSAIWYAISRSQLHDVVKYIGHQVLQAITRLLVPQHCHTLVTSLMWHIDQLSNLYTNIIQELKRELSQYTMSSMLSQGNAHYELGFVPTIISFLKLLLVQLSALLMMSTKKY